eukprot:g2076.t1
MKILDAGSKDTFLVDGVNITVIIEPAPPYSIKPFFYSYLIDNKELEVHVKRRAKHCQAWRVPCSVGPIKMNCFNPTKVSSESKYEDGDDDKTSSDDSLTEDCADEYSNTDSEDEQEGSSRGKLAEEKNNYEGKSNSEGKDEERTSSRRGSERSWRRNQRSRTTHSPPELILLHDAHTNSTYLGSRLLQSHDDDSGGGFGQLEFTISDRAKLKIEMFGQDCRYRAMFYSSSSEASESGSGIWEVGKELSDSEVTEYLYNLARVKKSKGSGGSLAKRGIKKSPKRKKSSSGFFNMIKRTLS